MRSLQNRTLLPAILLVCCVVAVPAMADEKAKAEEPEQTTPPEPEIKTIDQVQIQVWISETNEQGLRDIGANLDYYRFVREVEQSGSVRQISTDVADFGPQVTLPAPDADPYNLGLNYQTMRAQSGNPPLEGAGLELSIINPGYGTVEGAFRALETRSDFDLISKPELLVINNTMAEIHAGGEMPYQDVKYDKNANPQLNITWRKLGVNLKLQPLIVPDESVQLSIQELNVTETAGQREVRDLKLPIFSTRSQTGNVLVPNGQTLVIGGLSSRNVRNRERRVPIIGKVPVLGIPFRGRHSETRNTHLIVFVRPTIVDLREMTQAATDALSFWQERRWENTERIEQEISAMQEEL